MKTKQKVIGAFALSALCLVFSGLVNLRPTVAQEDQRDIESTEVLKSRRSGKNPNRTYRYRVRQRATASTPKPATQQFPIGPPPKGKAYATIGVTLWRGRPATPAASNDDKIAKVKVRKQQMVFERISDESPVTNGDLVQISIEYLSGETLSDRVGYLYVVNLEQYRNGTRGRAKLIFPTKRTFGGDNRVLPGKTVTLPDPQRPWQITRSTSGQVQAYETYAIIVSREPLELPTVLDEKPMELPLNQVAKWEGQWGGGEAQAVLQGGVGQLSTQREQAASGDSNAQGRSTDEVPEDLTQDDPPPQTVFRKVVQPGAAVLVTVELPFKETPKKP
jgi:hypothetical protein